MYRKLLVLTTALAMVYAGVLEHPLIVHAPLAVAAAPKIAAPAYSYYAAAAPKISFATHAVSLPTLSKVLLPAPKIEYTKLISAAPTLTYAAAAPKISFAPALSKVLLPAPKIALPAAPLSYVTPGFALPKLTVAAPAVHLAPAVKVVDAGTYDPNPEYSYSYNVDDEKSGDQKSFHESRSKDGTVSGSYSVVEPDGSKRTVEYTADHINGFKAKVSKEEAKPIEMKMIEMKMKEEAKQMEEAMKKGAVMMVPSAPEMMMVMKTEDGHAVVMKH